MTKLTALGFWCPPSKFGGVSFLLFKAERDGQVGVGATPAEAYGKLVTRP